MDPVIILLGIAAVLLIYQLFVAKDNDALDAYGHDINAKEKRD
jgi:hypothetical protein